MACTCHYCGREAKLVTGDVIYPHRPDLANLNFWLCAPCDAYVGCHKRGARIGINAVSDGTVPLGRLANAELRRWKSLTHEAFDPLWKQGGMTRGAAYAWLAHKLGIPKNECHIGFFTLEQCQEAVRICDIATGKAQREAELDAMFEARWGKAA